MAPENYDEFLSAVHRAREASDTILTTVTVGSLRAALARVRQVEAQLSEALARLAEIEQQEPVAVFKGAHDGRFVIDFLHGYIPPVHLALYAAPVSQAAQVAQGAADGVVLPDHEPTIAIGEILNGYDGTDREDVWDSIKAYADVHARAALEAASIPVLNNASCLWVAFSDNGAHIRMWSAEGPEKIADAGLTPIRFVLAAAQQQNDK